MDVDELSRHHIKPKRENGGDYFENILVLCRDCHDLIEFPIFNDQTIPKIKKYNKILKERGLSEFSIKIPENFSS